MEPITMAAIGASLLGPVIGLFSSSSERRAAKEAADRAIAYIEQLGLPPDQSGPIFIEELKSAGVWKPELEEAINVGVSQVSQIVEDPLFREKQIAQMAALEDITKTGMTATGRAEFNRLRAQAAADAESKRQAIMQQMQARGMGGSGAELVAQLQTGESGARIASEAADRIAAQQEQAKMAALSQLGAMAGQVRGQEFDIARTKSGAADQFRMFDVQNQLAQQARNVAARTEAAKYDVMNRQRLGDVNVQQRNLERQRQLNAQRQYWLDQAELAKMKSNAALGQSQMASQQAQNIAQGWTQAAAAGAGALATIGAGQAKAAKEDSAYTPPNTPPTTSTAVTPTSPKIRFNENTGLYEAE